MLAALILALPLAAAPQQPGARSVTVHSVCERDLFPWFRSLAFDVRAERTTLWP